MPKNILIRLFIVLGSALLVSCAGTTQFAGQMGQSSANYQPSPSRSSLGEEAFWQGNTNTIWDRLQHTSLSKLDAAANDPNPNHAGWIKLAAISKRYNNDSSQLVQQLIAWRNANSGHPGNALIPSESTLASLASHSRPARIALLLPLQGPLGTSGQAVRDGFLSAYYQSLAKTHIQQTISFVDTSQNPNIVALYRQAVSQGADMIVGPLTKENVQTLQRSGSISVPTLALNYTESGSSPRNFYEFGLSQSNETQQISDKAWQTGRSRALIIAPQNQWGQQLTKKLIARWRSVGGSITDTLYFTPQTNFNQAIPNLLHVNPKDDSKKMAKENNKTTLEQQRRQDFDVVFLLAEPQSAREIVPLLKYYYVDKIPIYSTSVIYSGSPNPQKDMDLNGVIFSDIPWMVKTPHVGNANRLYAVGRDAYAISSELSRLTNLPNFPLYAATGALTLTPSQQIYHRLPMVKMQNGRP